MINKNKFVFVDFETTGLGDGSQPVSIGAVMLDPRKLTICDNGLFYSLISVINDDEVEKYGLDKTSEQALSVANLTLGEINNAPPLRQVWSNFCSWIKYHTPSKDKWDAPIFCSFTNYDHAMVNRITYGHLRGQLILKNKLLTKAALKTMSDSEIAKAYKEIALIKEPWEFGPAWLFSPNKKIDVAQTCLEAFESLREPSGGSLDAIKSALGFPDVGAHHALVDALWAAEVFVRFLTIKRIVFADTDFETGGEIVLPIREIMKDFEIC
jgi:DNA polymerase III epsilon subunit-like protein